MHLSRSYVLALGVVAALALMWLVVLRPHTQGASTPSTPAPAPAHTASTSTAAASGSAPGIAGLGNAVKKAHGAVATSQQNAAQLQSQSAAAGNAKAGALSISPPGAAAGAVTAPSAAAAAPSRPAPASAAGAAPAATGDLSAAVQQDLVQGKVAVIVFWNSSSFDDRAVRDDLIHLDTRHGRVALFFASPDQIASFGQITRTVSVLQTPTVLVINAHGRTSTLQGFTDQGVVNQAIDDALSGAGAQQTPALTAWVAGSPRNHYIVQANALCKQPFSASTGKLDPSSLAQIRALTGTLAIASTVIGRMRGLVSPAADHAYLAGLYAGYGHGIALMRQAATAVSGHQLRQARLLVLQAQQELDRAGQGLADYGLTSCFLQEAR